MNKSFSSDYLQRNTMTLTGQGQVSSIPNLAVIRLGVQTTGQNLVETQSDNAQISQAILESLMQIGVSEIKTFQYLIEKNYIYEDGNQIDNGYNVRNILEIETSNMNQVGMVIDTAVNNGANLVELISFKVSDTEYIYQQALNLAVENAIQKAKSIAMNLGLPVDPVPFRIVENSPTQIIPTPFYAVREGNFATPIEPGNYLTNAFVTVDFNY